MQKYLSSKIITCKLTWYQKWVQQNFQTLYFFSIGELDVALTLTFVSQLKLVRRTSKTPDKLVEHVNPAKNMGLRMCLGHFWVQLRVPGLKCHGAQDPGIIPVRSLLAGVYVWLPFN